MRYDEMHKLYPQIEEYFAQAADQIHARQDSAVVLSFLELRVGTEIHRQHRKAVIDKLTRFAQLVEENGGADHAALPRMASEGPYSAPEICPLCGSLDLSGSVCRWCHSG